MEVGERVVGAVGSADERPQAADAGDTVAGARRLQELRRHPGARRRRHDASNAGEIVALLGENGAGKSTLIKIFAGVYTLDEGEHRFRGADATHALRRLPIAFIHQDLGLIDWMTVAENICLTLGYPRRLGMIDQDAARAPRRASRWTSSAPTSIPTCASRA